MPSRIVPANAEAAQKIPRLPKPKAAINQPPNAAAAIQPTLLQVTFRPRTVPRTASGTALSAAMNDGRPIEFASA